MIFFVWNLYYCFNIEFFKQWLVWFIDVLWGRKFVFFIVRLLEFGIKFGIEYGFNKYFWIRYLLFE